MGDLSASSPYAFRRSILLKAQTQWLSKVDVRRILEDHIACHFALSAEPPHQPASGSLLLFDKHKVKYRKDGHQWKKKKDGKTLREDHEKIKFNGVPRIVACYAHSEEIDTFHRRSYWLLEKDAHIVLVHYLDESAAKRGLSLPLVPVQQDSFPSTTSIETPVSSLWLDRDVDLSSTPLYPDLLLDVLPGATDFSGNFVNGHEEERRLEEEEEEEEEKEEEEEEERYEDDGEQGGGDEDDEDDNNGDESSFQSFVDNAGLQLRIQELELQIHNLQMEKQKQQQSLCQEFSTITEYSPDWVYTSGAKKLVITGTCFLPNVHYYVHIGDQAVEASVVQRNVLRCSVPPHDPGPVHVCVSIRIGDTHKRISDVVWLSCVPHEGSEPPPSSPSTHSSSPNYALLPGVDETNLEAIIKIQRFARQQLERRRSLHTVPSPPPPPPPPLSLLAQGISVMSQVKAGRDAAARTLQHAVRNMLRRRHNEREKEEKGRSVWMESENPRHRGSINRQEGAGKMGRKETRPQQPVIGVQRKWKGRLKHRHNDPSDPTTKDSTAFLDRPPPPPL